MINKVIMSIGALFGLMVMEIESHFNEDFIYQFTDPFVLSPLENFLKEKSNGN